MAISIKTDQPRVISIAEPPVVTDAGENLPAKPLETIPSGRTVTGMGAEGWTEMSTIQDNLTMDFTDPFELREDDPLQTDRYMDVYPDFHLPSEGHPKISEVYYANTQLISNDNFPLTLIHMPELERNYHTAMFGVDCGNGIVYAMYHEGVKITNRRGWVSEEESSSETDVVPPMTTRSPIVSTQPIAFPPPQAASTPAVNPLKRSTHVVSSMTQVLIIAPTNNYP